MIVRVKKLSDTAKLPVRGSAAAAGYDLYADLSEQTEIMPQNSLQLIQGLPRDTEARSPALLRISAELTA